MGLFDSGKINMKLHVDNKTVSPGDIISGNVTLNVKQKVHIRRFVVYFYMSANQIVESSGLMHSDGMDRNRNRHNRVTNVPLFTQTIKNETDLEPGIYTFDLNIPVHINIYNNPYQTINNVMKGASYNGKAVTEDQRKQVMNIMKVFTGTRRVIRSYYVKAVVDIPMGMDKVGIININVNPKEKETE